MCKMEGWVTDTLVNIFEVISGATPATEIKEYWDGDIVWITPNDLSKISLNHIDKSERMISAKGLKSCSANLIPSNSLVMSSRAPIGYLAISTTDYATNQGCKSLIVRDSTKHSADFHYFNLIFNMKKIKDLGTGTIFMEVSKKAISGVEIDFPSSLTEQQKIATILSTIDHCIAQTQQLIAKYKNIKQGLMLDLLSYGIDQKGNIRNPQTHMFEVKKGLMVPKEWDVKRIDEIAHVTGGKRLPAGHEYSSVNTGFRYLRVTDFYNKKVDYISLENIEERTFKALERYEIFPNDLFISIAGSIGYVGVNKSNIVDRIILTENALRIHVSEEVLPDYLSMQINSEVVQKQIWSEIGTGGGVPKLAKYRVESLLVPFPRTDEHYNEQQKILSILEQQDKIIESERTNLSKLQKLKQGLMQDLLTGKVRVKI